MSKQSRVTYMEEQNNASVWQKFKIWIEKISTVNQNNNDKFCRCPERKTLLLIILFILFATTVPFTVYHFWVQNVIYETTKSYTCVIDPTYKVPCGLLNLTCDLVGCCYDPEIDHCYHRIPAAYNYEKHDELTYKPIQSTTPLFTTSIEKLMLTVRDVDASRTQIILHDTTVSYNANEITEKDYIIKRDHTLLGVEVFRKTTLDRLLTTFRGPLIASEGYWEWSFQLTDEHLIGLGEMLFNNDATITKVIYKNENDHNTLPIFMAYTNGNFHGVVVEHQGLLEVSVLPSKLIILKSLSGSKIILDLYVGGPNPRDVVNKMRSYKPAPIPYWVLGAHICRDGLTTLGDAIDEYNDFVASENTVHYSSDCLHEDLYFMFNGGAEGKEEVKTLIEDLQSRSSHFMMSVTPHVQSGLLHDKAVELDLLYLYKNNILNGNYHGQKVVYPDFTHQSIETWIQELPASFPADKIDGFVLRDNWPVDENYQFINNLRFRYITKDISESLSETIHLDAYSKSETTPLRHILKHNQYGAAQAKAFQNLEHEFLMTSSYDYNIPEAALVQNVNISWINFKKAITTTLYHSVFGSSLISIPICGSTEYYNSDFHEELCIRWYILAATFPLFRISSELPRRDPSSLATQFAKDIAVQALKKRLLLLPYYYTTLNLDNILVRPMFYDFYFDKEVWSLDQQYMIGNALLVAHPVLPQTSILKVYLPPSTGVWYEYWGGRKYDANGWLTIDFVESDWVMFIQHEHIVPLRNAKYPKIGSYGPDDTYTFAIALNCKETAECKSEGQMMLTSASLKLSANYKTLVISNIMLAKNDIGCDLPERKWPKIIESAMVYGIYSDKVSYSSFTPVDLCAANSDEIFIEIFM